MISAVTAASSATGKSLVPAQITAMLPGAFGQGLFLDGHAAREFVVDGVLEFLPQRPRVFRA